MVLVLDNLRHHVPLQWILDHITIFAGDIHIYCLLRSEAELCDTIQYFEAVIHAIEHLGLTISAPKSYVILQGKGAGFLKWKKTRVKRIQQRQHCLTLCDGNLQIPIKKQMPLFGHRAFI